MKRIISFCILIVISLQTYSQMLTIDQAIAYRTKSVGAFEELMVNKKWELLSVEKPSGTTMGSISFSYNKSTFDDKAEGFATLLYSSYNQKFNRLSLQVVSNKVYSSAITRIKALGGKLLSSDVEEGEIIKAYQINNTVIKVITGTKSEEFGATKTTYIFILYALEDYKAKIAENNEIAVTVDPDPLSVDTAYTVEENESLYKERNQANELYNQKNYKGAIMFYLDAIKANRIDDIDYYSLGACYFNLEQYTSAIKYFNLYYKKSPDDVDVLVALSNCYFELLNIKMAIQYLAKACINNSTDINNCTLAWYFILDKQYTKALDYITIAEELYDGKNDDLFYAIQINKAHIYLLDGRLESAKLIHKKYMGNIVENSTWEEVVKNDFQTMKKYKIVNPNIQKIIELFK